jgi:hypothetical protein
LSAADAGDYNITVTHTGAHRSAITADDLVAANTLLSSSPPSKNDFFKLIAVDVASPKGTITPQDTILIRNKANIFANLAATPAQLCEAFPVGKEWTFVDSARTVAAANFSQAPDRIAVKLGTYIFETANFIGILYGDVNGNVNGDVSSSPDLRCDTSATNISGLVTYFPPGQPTPTPVRNVVVTLDGFSFDIDTTQANGSYTLRNIRPGMNYTIALGKTGDFAIGTDPGISVADATFLQDISNTLNDWQKIAANVQEADLPDDLFDDVTVREEFGNNIFNFLNNIAGGAKTGQWRFRRPNLAKPPFSPDLMQPNQNHFTAVLLGDVKGDWQPPASSSANNAGLKPTTYPFLQNVKLAPGDRFTLPLRLESTQAIRSATLDLIFEAKQLEIVKVEKSAALGNYKLSHSLSPGSLRAVLACADSAMASVSEVLSITFQAIGQPGDSSKLVLQNFSVNAEPGMTATARISLVKKVPQQFFLSQNYPNPFNPRTMIKYGLAEDEHVMLQVFNLIGQVVFTLVDQRQEAGYYEIEWNAADRKGRSVPSGIYFMRMQAGRFTQVRKLTVLR